MGKKFQELFCFVALIFLIFFVSFSSALTPLTDCANLSVPGVYTLQNDIVVSSSATCFNITADNVSLDLNGKTITGDNTAFQVGIFIQGNSSLVENGIIRNIGGYTGGGFTPAAIKLSGVFNFTLYNLTLYSNSLCIIAYFSKYGNFTNINCSNNSLGISLDSFGDYYLQNIISNYNSQTYGIYLGAGSDYSVLNNITCIGNNHTGIYLTFATTNSNFSEITLLNNSITDIYLFAAGNDDNNLFENYNIGSYNFGIASKLFFKNSQYGRIDFLEGITGSGTNLSRDINIKNNSVYVNSSVSGLNKSANVTLTGLRTNYANPKIYRDGINECNAITSPACWNFTSLNAGTVIFNVSSWSNYTIMDYFELTDCANLSVPGVYTLMNNVTTLGTCFNITSDNVTLNLNGFILEGDNNGVDYGIYSSGALNLSILNGSINYFGKSAGVGAGIYLAYVNNSRIYSINFSNNGFGIYVFNSSFNLFENLLLSANLNSGLYLLSFSSNNLTNIVSSYSSNNDAITLTSSSLNRFTNISVYNSKYGLFFSFSSSNIFHNLGSWNNTFNEIYSDNWGLSNSNIFSYNNSLGQIMFGALAADIEGNLSFPGTILIANNSASFNSSAAIALNVSANVTLTGLRTNYILPKIYRDGTIECNSTTSPACWNFTSLNAGTVIFNVSSWSNYTIMDYFELTDCGNLSVPGVYTLMNNVTTPGTCFNITSDNVTLNGNGYFILGQRNNLTHGIYSSGHVNLSINNISIRDFGAFSGFTLSDSGIYFLRVNNSQVLNVRSDYNYGGGIYAFQCNNDLFENISVSNAYNSTNVTVSRGQYGIKLFESANNFIINSIVNGSSSGILLNSVNHTYISNVVSYNNSYAGIDFDCQGSHYNTIVNSSFYSNSNSANICNTGNNDYNLFKDSFIDTYKFYWMSFVTTPTILYFENSTFGKIEFLSGIIGLGSNLFGSIDSDIFIGNNSVYVNSSVSGLNKSANVTLTGLRTNYILPKIYRDGTIECNSTTSPACYNFTSLNAGTVIFNVSSWSNYSIGEGADINPPIILLNYPVNSYSATAGSVSFSFNVSDSSNVSNCSLIINNAIYATNSSIGLSMNNILFSGSFSAGSYTWSVNCTDINNNQGNSSTFSFTMTAVSVVTDTGSGGGGGGTYIPPTICVSTGCPLASSFSCGTFYTDNCGNSCGTGDFCSSGVCDSGNCLSCIENWTCTTWGSCIDGFRQRTCMDTSSCGTSLNKPVEYQTCIIPSCTSNSDCISSDSCSVGTCNPISGKCQYDYTTSFCDDGNLCTINDKCSFGSCMGAAKVCDSGKVCQNGDCILGEKSDIIPFEVLNRISAKSECSSNFSCGAWSKCSGEYGVYNLINAKEVSLTQERICVSQDECKTTYSESRLCPAREFVEVRNKEWCGQNYTEVLNNQGAVVARIKTLNNGKSVNVDFNTLENFCAYCYNGKKDYDEIDVDCGGSCPLCISKKLDFFKPFYKSDKFGLSVSVGSFILFFAIILVIFFNLIRLFRLKNIFFNRKNI
jgi:hypothetical protein